MLTIAAATPQVVSDQTLVARSAKAMGSEGGMAAITPTLV